MRSGRRTQWFWEKVVIPDALKEACWEWSGEHGAKGYARFRGEEGENQAHRFSYQLLVGELLGDLTIDHTCGNTGCVNPFHLEQVPGLENTKRAAQRRTHCRRGHPFTPENTYRGRDGKGRVYRSCRQCNIDRLAARRRAEGRPKL